MAFLGTLAALKAVFVAFAAGKIVWVWHPCLKFFFLDWWPRFWREHSKEVCELEHDCWNSGKGWRCQSENRTTWRGFLKELGKNNWIHSVKMNQKCVKTSWWNYHMEEECLPYQNKINIAYLLQEILTYYLRSRLVFPACCYLDLRGWWYSVLKWAFYFFLSIFLSTFLCRIVRWIIHLAYLSIHNWVSFADHIVFEKAFCVLLQNSESFCIWLQMLNEVLRNIFDFTIMYI